MNQKRKDQTKKLERELILNKIEAREGVHQLVLILDHLKSGFNIGKIIRTRKYMESCRKFENPKICRKTQFLK